MNAFDLIVYGLAVLFGVLAAGNVPARVSWLGLAVACLALPPFVHALVDLT